MSTQPDQDALDMVLGVFEEEQKADLLARFGEVGYRHWHEAPNRVRLERPTVVGTVTGSCGDTISIALAIEGEAIVATDFDTDGCASSQIAASVAATLAKGKTLDEAVDIDDATILATIGTFPENDTHCAYLAAAAVREAVHRWMIGSGMLKLG